MIVDIDPLGFAVIALAVIVGNFVYDLVLFGWRLAKGDDW